jgi:2'-5' RNA ligase
MKRIFAAVKIEPDVNFLKSFRELRNGLGYESIKWVEEHNIHITVKFFGETDERQIPFISETLGDLSQNTPELKFRLSGIGIFGSKYQPRVIWAGIEPPGPLARLMNASQLEFEKSGYSSDRQNLVPHLTLGRIKYLKNKTLFQTTINKYAVITSEPLVINECILFESILKREGPEYRVLGKFPFVQPTV